MWTTSTFFVYQRGAVRCRLTERPAYERRRQHDRQLSVGFSNFGVGGQNPATGLLLAQQSGRARTIFKQYVYNNNKKIIYPTAVAFYRHGDKSIARGVRAMYTYIYIQRARSSNNNIRSGSCIYILPAVAAVTA